MQEFRLGVHGATGKMGKSIISCIKSYTEQFSHIKLTAKFSSSNNQSDFKQFFDNSDVIVDFSLKEATKSLLTYALKHIACHIINKLDVNSDTKFAPKFVPKFVIGTTSLDEECFNMMNEIGKKSAVFYSPNTSLGINVLAKILKLASTLLPEKEFDAGIIDIHHKYKKDSPSGTALMLKKQINYDNVGGSSLKIGSIFGEHEVIFTSMGETLSFKHTARDRQLFSSSALKICSWIASQDAGFYSMDDYLDSVNS